MNYRWYCYKSWWINGESSFLVLKKGKWVTVTCYTHVIKWITVVNRLGKLMCIMTIWSCEYVTVIRCENLFLVWKIVKISSQSYHSLVITIIESDKIQQSEVSLDYYNMHTIEGLTLIWFNYLELKSILYFKELK